MWRISKEKAQQDWKRKITVFAGQINAFVERGLTHGWDKAGKEPRLGKVSRLVPHVLAAVREANAKGDFAKLRHDWPPAHAPFIDMLDENGQSIPEVCLLEDGRIIARIGAAYEAGYVIEIQGDQATRVPGVEFFGFSGDRKYFASAGQDGIRITDGWGGEAVKFFNYPSGKEGVPEAFAASVPEMNQPPAIEKIIPYDGGERVLLVTGAGIFVLTSTQAIRILPGRQDIEEHFTWMAKEYPNDEPSYSLDMGHAAISPDEKWIAIGSQDSVHIVLDARRLEPVAIANPESSYPHHAVFSPASDFVAFNSCHFYNGTTIGIDLKDIADSKGKDAQEIETHTVLEEDARVYAAVASGADEFIIGDAYGYLRAIDRKGRFKWQHFIGSSVSAIDIAPDGKTLIASTSAGFLCIIQLHADARPDYQIGTADHHELRRWIFWKSEERPLIW